MKATLRKVQILAQAQATVLRTQARKSVHQLALLAVGLTFALFALGMVNHAGYTSLEADLGPVWAGLIVGGVDLLVASLFFWGGLREGGPSEEERLAREITELTTESLAAELEIARVELREFMVETKRLGQVVHDVTAIVNGPVVHAIRLVMDRPTRGDGVAPK